MNSLRIPLLVLLSLLSISLFSQNLDFQWAHAVGGPQSDPPSDVAVDSEGNLFYVGGFSGTTDFDPSENTVNLTSLGTIDIFIAKYSPEGNFIWVKHIGGYASENAVNIVIKDDHVYISGSFDGILDFDPGVGASTLTTNGWTDCFLMKMNLDGELEWVRSFGGSDLDHVQGLAVDHDGNPLITGYFIGEVDFNPTGSPQVYTANGYNDAYVCKYNSSGDLIWAKQLNGSGSAFSKGISYDQDNNVYFAGYFTEEMDTDPGEDEHMILSNGLNDVFITKLSGDGDFIWSKSYGAWSEDRAFAIEFTSDNRFYVGGYYRGDVDFDPNDGELTIPSANGSEDYFIQQFDADGNLLWAHGFGGNQSEFLHSLAVDISNNVYICGSAASIYDADPSENEDLITNTAPFAKNAIIHKLSDSGNHIWAYGFGSNEEDFGRGIFVGSNRDVFVTGQFRGLADLNPLDGESQFTSAGFSDAFVLKLSQCQLAAAVLEVSSCEASYTWIDGITYETNQEGVEFLLEGVAAGQCDSLYTLQLDFIDIDNSLSASQSSLEANQDGAAYQWYTCGSDMLAIEGANNQTYTPLEEGSYLVEISIDGCTSTSECVFFSIVSSGSEIPLENAVSIYPNPNSGDFQVHLSDRGAVEEVMILNYLGQKVPFEMILTGKDALRISLSNPVSGLFSIKMKQQGHWMEERILIQ